MNAAVVERAHERLGLAQTALQAALESGGDTVAARDRLKRAKDDAAAVQAQAGQAAERAEADRRARLHEAAASAVQTAEQQIAAQVAQLVAVTLPAITLPADVQVAVLDARHRAAQAAQVAADASAKVARLQDRQQQLAQRRASIVARRQAGGGDDATDGAELALIEADGSGVAELLEQATAAAAGPVRQAGEAVAAVSHAETLWAQAVQRATAQALAEICRSLEATLVRAASELYPHRLSGGVTAWQPRQELKHLLAYGSPMGRTA